MCKKQTGRTRWTTKFLTRLSKIPWELSKTFRMYISFGLALIHCKTLFHIIALMWWWKTNVTTQYLILILHNLSILVPSLNHSHQIISWKFPKFPAVFWSVTFGKTNWFQRVTDCTLTFTARNREVSYSFLQSSI